MNKTLSPCARKALGALGLAVMATLPGVSTALDTGLDGVTVSYSRPYGAPALPVGDGMPLGESVRLYPAVGIGVDYDDNIYRESTDTSSANIYRLNADIELMASTGVTNFFGGYKGRFGEYSGGPNDDIDSYDDHNIHAGAYHNGRNTSANIYAERQRGHYSRGQNNLDEKDTWDRDSVIGWVDLGARDARFNLRIDGLASQQRHDEYESLDLDTGALGALLAMRVGSKTRLVLEGGLRQFDYQNSNADADRSYIRGGVMWEATGKTTGILTYGYEDYKPDNAGQEMVCDAPGPCSGLIEKSDGPTWKGEIRWEPTRRDTLELQTGSGTVISYGTGSSRVADRTLLSWVHDWTSKVDSNVGALVGKDDYNGIDRNDDLVGAEVGFGYKPRRNMLLRGSWNYEDRDSNVATRDYDRNIWRLFFDYEF